ncbi:MAG TPA: hypothetical protein IAA29_06680, partial [Candidatus Paenibacillus intestinavium]|nr:hypothetical protein [Candidatus Paenibacillus intestinavium]
MAKSIEELLLQKAGNKQKKQLKKQKLHIKSIDDVITILEPDKALVFEIAKMVANDNADDANAKIVYECVVQPNLKELLIDRSVFPEPLEAVKKMFEDDSELELISEHIGKLGGMFGKHDSVRIVD